MFKKNGSKYLCRVIALCLLLIIVNNAIVSSEEIYRFERMWPTLQQPWHFFNPQGIAIDEKRNVYIVDFLDITNIKNKDLTNVCVKKFTDRGRFITGWGKVANSSSYDDGDFVWPEAIAIDKGGNVYVGDSWDGRIQKFSSEGEYLLTWSIESNIQPTRRINDIVIDDFDNVYVVDSEQNQVLKFTTNGEMITSWGGAGSNQGEFNFTEHSANQNNGSIAVDSSGKIYVLDTANHRIQKFDSNGNFLSLWGSFGSEAGEFQYPETIAIDQKGILFVADSYNQRIQKFTTEGEFVGAWGKESGGESGALYYPDTFPYSFPIIFGLYYPVSLAIDPSGMVYVGDSYYARIQKFNSECAFFSSWGSGGTENGKFYKPHGVTLDEKGHLYVVENSKPNRIQKFNVDGVFIDKWGGRNTTEQLFKNGANIEVDENGIIYVITSYGGVTKISRDGSYVQWETDAVHDGDIAVGGDGHIYITAHQGVQKLDTNGDIIETFGESGTDDGHFDSPQGVAIDSTGNMYISDTNNHRIQILDSNGRFIRKWGGYGFGNGEFDRPLGIAVDGELNVYVSDHSFRIQKFTAQGDWLSTFGGPGRLPGKLYYPTSLSVDDNGTVYVADSYNNRVQVFRKGLETDKITKAIIVAGRLSKRDALWASSRMCANFTYRALANQGFTKEAICYLTSDTDLDLDNNGELDDVDGDAIDSEIQKAITEWARDADRLVIYMTDHGMSGDFFMSEKETLSAAQLDDWLNALQGKTECNEIILVYDACRSGSFLQSLASPPAGKSRIIITSTRPQEDARYISQGSISFSSYFWTHIFNGNDIHDAFVLASNAMGQATQDQHPQLDANGNGVANEAEDFELAQNQYIGNGAKVRGEAPKIESVVAEKLPDTNSVLLKASSVTDADGIARVWAILRPPEYQSHSSISAELEFPSVDLIPAGNDAYEITHDDFNIAGNYQIAIYALDQIGNTCVPSITSVTIETPLRRKAIIIAGGPPSAPLWTAIEKNAKLSYEAMKFQGYSDDDIYFMSPVTFSSGVDVLPCADNVEDAMAWAFEETQDVLLYFIGNTIEGDFQLNEDERLASDNLTGYLDTIQANIPGKVTLILDACQSGNYISQLTPPENKERILIASATGDQPAVFLQNGDICFSKFFWRHILNGANVRDAFNWAKSDIQYFGLFSNTHQTPMLDDDGNGVGNEKSEGKLARNHKIGVGIMLADVPPVVGGVSPEQVLNGKTSATIWAENVTAPNAIEEIWAVIMPPENNRKRSVEPITDLDAVPLELVGDNRYEATFNSFDRNGEYRIVIYAKDQKGEISTPTETTVRQNAAPDLFEDDDAFDAASIIVLNKPTLQRRNFHDAGDEDWVRFYGLKGQTYTASAQNLESNCDIVIEIFDTDGSTLLVEQDTSGDETADEFLPWPCLEDGVYYVKFSHYDETASGENTGYECGVSLPLAPERAVINTDLLNSDGTPIGDAIVKNETNATAISEPDDGSMEIVLGLGQQILEIMTPDGRTHRTEPFNVSSLTNLSPIIIPILGDPNGDDAITIADVIVGLKTIAQVSPSGIRDDYKTSGTDVNGDDQLGLQEIIYDLQKVAGLRP